MKLIQNGLADFAPFEPEDMYISAKFMDDFLAAFLETRTTRQPLGKKKKTRRNARLLFKSITQF